MAVNLARNIPCGRIDRLLPRALFHDAHHVAKRAYTGTFAINVRPSTSFLTALNSRTRQVSWLSRSGILENTKVPKSLISRQYTQLTVARTFRETLRPTTRQFDYRSAPLISTRNQYCTKPDTERKTDEKHENDAKPPQSKSFSVRMKELSAQYGRVVIGVYVVYDIISMASFYSAVKMGFDVTAFLEKVGIDTTDATWANSTASTLVVAYAAHKIFAPVRVFLTVVTTPYIVQLGRRLGYMKVPAKVPMQEVQNKMKSEMVKRGEQMVDRGATWRSKKK